MVRLVVHRVLLGIAILMGIWLMYLAVGWAITGQAYWPLFVYPVAIVLAFWIGNRVNRWFWVRE